MTLPLLGPSVCFLQPASSAEQGEVVKDDF